MLIWNLWDSYYLFPTGFVIGKKILGKRKVSSESSNCWEVNAKFDKLTYWNHDDFPSKDDALVRAFQLFAVADAVSFFSFLILKGTCIIYHHKQLIVHQ